MIRSLILTFAAGAWFGTVAAPPAWAQPYDEAAIGQPAPAASSYTEAELRSVAFAVVEVKRLNDLYLPRLQAAASSAEQQEVRDMATVEMRRAIEKHLSVDRYTEIVTLARLDEDLADRIREQMSKAGAP